jgi:glycerol-3-phosphate acyltransferase PlsY
VIRVLIVLALGYLLGSIPSGLWLGKIIGGVDVRTIGSGRTGATSSSIKRAGPQARSPDGVGGKSTNNHHGQPT